MPKDVENPNTSPVVDAENLKPRSFKIPKRLMISLAAVILFSGGAFAVILSTSKLFNSTKSTQKVSSEKINSYVVNANLKELYNAEQFEFTEKEQEMLEKNGFFVSPAWENEFYSVYEDNRYNYIPNFVTTDSILHNYHLMFNHILQKLEENQLSSALLNLNKIMLSSADETLSQLRGTDWENAAKRNLAFFAVASKLLDPKVQIPSIVKDEVEKELELIDAHDGLGLSFVMNIGVSPTAKDTDYLMEDYSQYVPRGHYTKSDLLKNYFKCMMWYGRLTFRFKNPDEIKSALLITATLKNPQNLKIWQSLFDPISFFVGKTDDITFGDMDRVLKEVYGSSYSSSSITSDLTKLDSVVAKLKALQPPQINSMPIFDASISPDRDEETMGFRFMGQRFTIDAAIFQKLVYREVGEDSQGGRRMLPKGLDIPAALGSEVAYNLLKNLGENKYSGYDANMSKIRKYILGLSESTWKESLYWMWMDTLRSLLDERGSVYPDFMRTYAWRLKELQTFLGSWTELKHDTILYAKQAYAELGGGPADIKEWDDRGYVEPNPVFYARLSVLLDETKKILNSNGMLSSSTSDSLTKMKSLVDSLRVISDKELAGTPLTREEYELIRSYGGQLEHFWLEVNREDLEKSKSNIYNYLSDNPAALIADVASDPNGRVLEEATGNVNNIFVIVSVDGKKKISKGSVFSYYEFEWPLSDRLTDEKWREIKDTDKVPAQPSWTDEFTVRE